MNAHSIISPAVDALDRAQEIRAEAVAELPPIPPQPAEAYDDPSFIETHDGIAIWKLQVGLYYNYETGCTWTLAGARADIDAWRDKLNDEYIAEGPGK